ncbi:LCP family protein [Microbispora sp. ATCC PTA-5024]|uniref:LCP family protein n=1 Tax=Microbispora sp. ATCC PTA-5024 TaxID=316330 RepID=UPI0003DBCFE6|nr:LCP family protein [Microbispora sp. ATCC PTA-5024]ETK35138.1 transcriptional regulator [Microbispora sp. ATCC PTA-5024]
MGHVDVRPAPPAEDLPAPPRTAPKWRAWLWVALSGALGVVVAAAGSAVGGYVKLSGNVRHETVTTSELGTRPAKISKALNVLIVGSDQRDGANARYGKVPGERTDTIILAHISPKRDGAVLISFPRDSLVQLPGCPAKKSQALPGQRAHVGMINESFNFGGIACTWRTIEGLTGIHIDHFVKVDFTGFKAMVNALGGVPVCIPEPIDDKKALLHLKAGKQLLMGEQALGYVRVRYSIGDGSDIGRIQRQQMFLASMAKKAMSGQTLTNPSALFGFLDAVTKSITTDPDLTLGVMKDLAMSAKGLTAGQIRFVTTPWRYSVANPGRVEWVEPQADRLFKMVAADEISKNVKSGEQKIPKSQIHIVVQNGTGTQGLGTQVAAELEQRGYHIVKVEPAPKQYAKSVIKYGPNGESRAARLFRELKRSTTFQVKAAQTQSLVLVVGADWNGLKPPKSLDDVEGFDATQDSCTAS